MKIHRGRLPGAASENRTETFTGTVWGDPILAEAPALSANTVCFMPGGRTYWHSHGGGQILVVTHGRGFVQNRDDERSLISPGDVVYVPPGEEHWHGAADDSLLVHVAISLGPTQWLSEVEEEQYRRVVAVGS
ncbi:MAG: cupin domain-containing protein [Streptosporangiales bacterium]|nr:cupin domain-containing protein [Streptosporangiales bacterium]